MPTIIKMSNTYWCFPEKSEFEKQYMKKMEDKYLAEKTLKTVIEWLADKKKTDFKMVARYAELDFNKCTGSTPPQFIRTMNNEH